MSSNKLYIQITHACDIYGVPHRQRQQYEYIGSMYREIDHRDGSGTMLYYVGLNCDDIEVFIPSEYSIVVDKCIEYDDQNVFRYIQKRDMDKTQDYYKKVKELLDIDMSINHVAQINPEHYHRLDLKVPIIENNINEKTS